MEQDHNIERISGYTPPASTWVRFLRSYGPIHNNSTLFDEHVTGALGRARVAPIALSSPRLDDMLGRIESGIPGSILITGTAGDGKTYHCRSLWTKLGGGLPEWAAATWVKRLTLSDGREAVFVKDLSELDEAAGDAVLDTLERSVLDGDDSTVVVLAANHGQILERLRSLGTRRGSMPRLRKSIQEAFLQSESPIDRLLVVDLSRSAHRQSLEEVFQQVAGHPEWDRCLACQLNGNGRVCPIAENRSRILGQADAGRFRRRLGDLVEIARLNGAHLPVRDLLALAANSILGHRDARDGLLSCAEVARVQTDGTVESGSLYDNVFGINLPRRRTDTRPVFRVMATFGIGEETTNAADGLLVFGTDDAQLRPAFDRFVRTDGVYGATARFIGAQQRYLEGEEDARQASGATDFLDLLEQHRRRLFFTLPEDAPDYRPWDLTAFRSAGQYLALISALTERRQPDDGIRERLARGLNRVMTGLLMDNADKIFIASSGGFTQAKINVLCDTEVPGRRLGGVGMAIRMETSTHRPYLDVALAPSVCVKLGLTPVRFEFLSRVADGALPGSFSNECLEDLLAFKAQLLRQAERVRGARAAGNTDDDADDETVLSLNFIEIEKGGHGYCRPVTVRVGA